MRMSRKVSRKLTEMRSFIMVVPSPSARRRILLWGLTLAYIPRVHTARSPTTPRRSRVPTAFAWSRLSFWAGVAEPWHFEEDALRSWSAGCLQCCDRTRPIFPTYPTTIWMRPEFDMICWEVHLKRPFSFWGTGLLVPKIGRKAA